MWLSASAVACKDGTIRSGLTIKIIIVKCSTPRSIKILIVMMTTNIFAMITMKTTWAPAKSNWGDGEVGDAEEQVGGGEGGQQAVEHRPHLPGGVCQDQHLHGGGRCLHQDQNHKLVHNNFQSANYQLCLIIILLTIFTNKMRVLRK